MYVSFKENLKGVNLFSHVVSEPTSGRMSSVCGGMVCELCKHFRTYSTESNGTKHVTQHSETQGHQFYHLKLLSFLIISNCVW